MLPTRSGLRSAAVVLCAFAGLPSAAAAQQTITTSIGDREIIAVAVNPTSAATYFATDRPGAIYRAVPGSSPVLLAGVSGGPTSDGVQASQAAVFPVRNGLAVDTFGNIYFSEPALHRIRQISPSGTVNTIAGGIFGTQLNPIFVNGNPAISTDITAPGALAFNPVTGDLFIADESWDVVYQIVSGGAAISGNSPLALAVGGDRFNTRIYVESQFFNPYGYEGDGGAAKDAKLNHPRGLAFDATGNLYIADTGNNVIRRVDASSNTITTFAGTSLPGFSGDGQAALTAQLFMPTGLAVDAHGSLIVADTSNHVVRSIAADGTITTIAGTPATAGHDGDGFAATSATLAYPTGVAVNPGGDVLIVDSQNNRLRGVFAGQTITTIAQNGPDYTGDGAPGGSAVNRPLYIAFDRAGNMFFSDSGNARVRRVDAATHKVTTVAGNGIPGYAGDGDWAMLARLNCPAGLAFGPGGELYIADPCAQVVRRVSTGSDENGLITGNDDPGETITTYAGNGIGDSFAGPDGVAANTVSLWNPVTVATSSSGTLLIGEPDIAFVRSVDTGGTLGTYTNSADSRGLVIDSQDHVILGDDSEADAVLCDGSTLVTPGNFGLRFGSWAGLSLDGLQRLFVTERQSQSIFQVTDSGGGTVCGGSSLTVARIAGKGTGAVGYSGDGADASSALLNSPTGTGFDGHATLYVADTGNNVIRRVEQSIVAVQTNVSTLDFGSDGLLVTTAAKTVIVTSIGTTPAVFTASTLTGVDPGDFIITSDGCKGQSLSTGQSCQVQVAFKATDVGPRSATLQINDNAPAPQTVFLTGIGASLTVAPDALSFGDQTLLVPSAATTVTVTNTTPSPVTIGPLSFVNSSDFSISSDLCTGRLLLSQTSCTFGVVFTPHNLGPSAATLNVGSTAGDSPRQLNVGGNGIPAAPKASFSQVKPFGSQLVGTKSDPQFVVLTSAGTAPLSVTTVALTGDQPTDFKIMSDGCTGATLTPSQTCTVQIQFTPQETCNSHAALTFTDGAADSPQGVAVSGVGLTAPASLFGTGSVCLSHGSVVLYLAAGMDGEVWAAQSGNRFTQPAIVEATAADGETSQNFDILHFGGYDPFELTTAPDGSFAFGEAVPNGLLQSYVALVNTANLKVESPKSFIGPIAIGPEGGFWVASQFSCGNDLPLITVFAPDGTTTSYTPTPQWIFGHTGHFCIQTSTITTASDGTVWLGTTNNRTGLAGGTRSGIIRVTPDGTFVDFLPTDGPPAAFVAGVDGNMYALVGSSNVCGLERFDASGHALTIPMPPSVNLTCAGSGNAGNIADGADGRLWMYGTFFTGTMFEPTMIAFDPLKFDPLDPTKQPVSSYPMPQFAFPTALFLTNALVAGPDEGIWFVAPFSSLARFDLGGGPARAFINPRVVSMPFTSLGVSSKPRTIYVRSTGTAPLMVSSVTLSGLDAPQFILSDHCSGKSLNPGQLCTIQVASRPTKAGSHRATLNVISNDGFSPQRVQLAEFALPPGPTLDPSSVAFPSTLVGKAGKTSQFILTNPADRAIAINSIAVTGVNAADFTITSNQCGNTVAAGGTCTVAVQFTPSAAGTRRASLVVTDSAAPSTVSALLTGTGQSQSGGGTTTTDDTCNCATGLFVNPTVVAPSATFVSASASATTYKSPNGVYTLVATPNGPHNGPNTLTVKKGTTTLVTFTSPADATWPNTNVYGFSPDDDRFIVHYVTTNHDTIDLFDLTGSTPNTHVWEGSVLVSSDGTGTIATGSVAFSPHGNYIVATQIESFVGVGVAPTQTAFMNLVSAKGAVVTGRDIEWQLSSPPTDQEEEVESAHWGFAPDDQSFVFIHDQAVDGPVLDLYALPSGVKLKELTSHDGVSKYVQFGPCGEVLAVVETTSASNPLTITLYSTRGSNAGQAIAPTQTDLPAVAVVLMATTTKYTAHLAGVVTPLTLAANASASGCADPTTSGDAGGSSQDTAPQFTTDTPLLQAIQGVAYSYTFHAVGSPDPTYSLDAFAPTWLTIDSDTGELSGTPPVTNVPGTFTFTVTATNRASFDVAGPFTVTLSPPSSGGGGGGGAAGPSVVEGEPVSRGEVAAAAPVVDSTPTATTLLLPNGRGQIHLAADVTPAVSTFTYTETDSPSELGNLVFAGLDFTLTAVDAQSGGSVGPLIDAPRATIVLRGAELQTARIRDYSRLGLYWWNGTAWINQLPCAGCGVSADGTTLTALLPQVGEYMLAATPLPAAAFSIAVQPIHVTVGDVFAGTVATFPPALPLDIAGDYAAIIDWGDGQVSPGTVSAAGGSFAVTSSHSWTAAGNYPVRLTIFDGADSGTAQTTANVSPLPQPPVFTAAAPPLTATAGSPYWYTFAASGVPAPSFTLGAGAPTWLTIGGTTGVVSGTPPSGTTSFTYRVVAANGVSPNAVAGPFTVTVASTTKPSADLSIAISGPATARKGSTVTYTIVVTNHGPSAAVDGTLLLVAGPGATLTSATPQASVNPLGLLTWGFAGLDAGASKTFTVNLKLTKEATVVLVGAVGASTRDPNLVNNVAVAGTTVK